MVWIDKAGQLVDVPVGVVADDAAAEPEDVGRAEVIAEVLLDVGLGKLRVAIWVEQALLGGEQRAAAVDVDRAAFQDDARREDGGGPGGDAMCSGTASSRSNGGYLPPQAL